MDRYLVAGIILAVVAIAALVFWWQQSSSLPDSFAVRIFGDYGSSAADRSYSAILNFSKGKLVSGWQRYSYWATTGDKGTFECVADVNLKRWIAANNTQCYPMMFQYAFTKDELKKQLEAGDLKPVLKEGPGCVYGESCPLDGCPRRDTCYEILPA